MKSLTDNIFSHFVEKALKEEKEKEEAGKKRLAEEQPDGSPGSGGSSR